MLALIVVLIILSTLILTQMGSDIFRKLNHIIKEIKIIRMSQEEFDNQIAEANQKLDGLGEAIAAERQQIADFIASQPAAVDTSALTGVLARLGGISETVSGIFTPPSTGEGSGDEDDTSGTEG
jgi:predicted PurR-regulated permease PerM